MGVISKSIKVRPTGNMIAYYKSKGYDAKHLQELEIKIEDLSKCSTVLIEVECDYCNQTRRWIKYVDYNAQTKNGTVRYCCSNCIHLKQEETMIKKYGYKNPLQVPEIKNRVSETNQKRYGSKSPAGNLIVKEKQKQTFLERYGVEYPSKSKEIREKQRQTILERYGTECLFLNPEIQEKIKQINFERYGVENVLHNKEIRAKRDATLIERYGTLYPLQNEECFEKLKQTNMKKYGVQNISQLDETKQKVKNTNLERYGYKNPMQSPELLEKWFENYGSNFVRASSQQIYICNLYNGILNQPFKCFALDVFLPNDNLDVEFNGSGHKMSVSLGSTTEEKFKMKEVYRGEAIKKAGYKRMTIVSIKDLLPSDQILLQMLDYSRNYFSEYPNHSWIEWDIDTSTVRNAEQKDGVFFDYGKLRKIKK